MDTTKKSADAEIRFHCNKADFVEVSEVQNSGKRQTQKVPRTADIVSELEKRYIFSANEAAHARKMITGGHSCAFYVTLREP